MEYVMFHVNYFKKKLNVLPYLGMLYLVVSHWSVNIEYLVTRI